MSDTSSVQDSDAEDDNDEEVPVVTLHPKIGFEINTTYECPLASSSSEHTLAAAQASAQQGCPRCILRAAVISEIFPNIPASAIIECSHDSIFLPFRIDRQRVVLASHDQHEDEEQLICEFYDDEIGGIGCVERVVPCDTNSVESLETVKKWIRICDNDHDCLLTPKSLPRRLLDVRHGCVRLHETIPSDTGSLYACLSHCWGKPTSTTNPVKTTLRTTLTTVDTYRKAVTWEDLPPTFQDAISFTRKLDIPFLWIDSLCIIQDDINQKDWQEQSANMSNIYRNAYITLAATSAEDAHGGMYTRDDVTSSHQVGAPLVVVQYADGRKRDLFARRKFGHEMDTLPLLKRGWVYQERLLSPRVLHFVGEELIWECNHMMECECGGDNLEHKLERARLTDSSRTNSFSCIGPQSVHPEPLSLWYQIVDEYSALALTKGSDKFPALSGIAKVYAAETRDEYMAGMWRRTLVANLLWYYMGGDGKGTQDKSLEDWRAPSWSWASRFHDLEFRVLPTTEELAMVTKTSCRLSGIDPTGELVTASLTLKTKVLSAHLHHPDKTIHIDDFIISAALPHESSYCITDLCTGYIDLQSTSHSNLLLAQIAKCTGQRRVYLYDIRDPLPIMQEVRSYMILVKSSDDTGWTRIGLATIALYEPNKSLFHNSHPTLSTADKETHLRNLSRSEITTLFEGTASSNQRIFRRFDDAQSVEILIS